MERTWFIVFCAIGVALSIEHDFKGFDDSILFGINWPGPPDVQMFFGGGDNTLPGTKATSVSTDC